MSLSVRRPASYLDLGWPAEEHDGHTELITGTVVDALEVPSAAGILAASWWRFSEGSPDEIRGLPGLPDPRRALALVAAGERHFFLTLAGECPWQTQDPVTTAATTPRAAIIRWHSQGSRIPLPNSGTDDTSLDAPARWVHWPGQGVKLPSPAVLLHLLATATAATRLGPNMLTLTHDVLAIPVFGDPPTTAASPRVSPAAAFGFGRDQ
jgi:hypothetical protein